jgi:hypothetical protein
MLATGLVDRADDGRLQGRASLSSLTIAAIARLAST